MYVCVCVYVCVYVCVCVFGSISGFFSPFSSPNFLCSFSLRANKGSWLLCSFPLRDFVYSTKYLIFFAVFFFFTGISVLVPRSEICLEILILLHRCSTVDGAIKLSFNESTSNYCGYVSVSSLCCLATRRVNKISTVKVFSSSVKINERFGTAIAFRAFSIRSY